MQRKFMSEFGLHVYVSYKRILPVEGLALLETQIKDPHNYHIYLLLDYPKLYYDFQKCYVDGQGVHLSIFEADSKRTTYDIPAFKPFDEMKATDVQLNSEYPYHSLAISITNATALEKNPLHLKNIDISAQDLFFGCVPCLRQSMDFEVLYIGQAYGQNGERSAVDRLSSHSTLQKILTDYHCKNPNRHLYVLLLEITPQINMVIDGMHKNAAVSGLDDVSHMSKVLSTPLIEKQIINITEAALINYFKPPYNVNFIENFPDNHHIGYKQYYDLEYNCITVEVDLSFDNFPTVHLHSQSGNFQTIFNHVKYNLFNDPDRLNMYDIFK